MKLSSKSISSPGRAEKYPPPLMRFLRSNVGSRSRGRSRTSPMFVRRKNTAIETQEPSSPKVTCMGQVRVKRSKQSGSKPGRSGALSRRHSRCKWMRNALFCHHLSEKVKAKPFCRPAWKKWGWFFHMGSCSRKPKTREDSSRFGNKIEDCVKENEEEESEENEKDSKIFVSSSCSSPPKNALILTRCRSAPYRSSSLACRFWGSPLANQDSKEKETELENGGFKEEKENPTSEKQSICRNSDYVSQTDSETEEKPGCCKEFEEKIIEKFENNDELKTGQFGNVRPLILTRCKSEPARTAERLDPEMSFRKKGRLGFT
ncbi:uncharacterized protein LOC111311863 [Durio zibethinus]|uniref:Uncharacterized protein LOC111311863 n=1 Tax=Durio zibethinus TaxID=66656 RepID=A0A6P6AR66_DURZI|nr:uncharacterized protein LOC111311863 [Durio zibethinus]